MKSYYIHDGQQKHGPFSLEELRPKEIKRDTPVWREGLEDWINAGELNELSELFQRTPPPFKQPPQHIQKKAIYPASSARQVSGTEKVGFAIGKLIRNTTAVIVIAIVAIIIYYNVTDQGRSSSRAASLITFDPEHANPSNYLVANGTYHPNFWGNQLVINGTVANNAGHTNYKDVLIKVTFYSQTSTAIESKNYVIYDFVPYGSSKSFELRVEKPAAAKTCGWQAVGATYY